MSQKSKASSHFRSSSAAQHSEGEPCGAADSLVNSSGYPVGVGQFSATFGGFGAGSDSLYPMSMAETAKSLARLVGLPKGTQKP